MPTRPRHFFVLLAIGLSACDRAVAEPPSPSKDTLVTISKDTTVLTKPLDEEGYVDLLAGINQRLREGVTPENNAVVPLRIALGLVEQRGDAEYLQQFDKMLGIDSGGEGIFVPLADIARDLGVDDANEAYDMLGSAHERPWTANDYPVIAAWLLANEPAMEMITEATRRPRFYAPYIASNSPPELIAVLLPVLQETRRAARALVARAMLHAGEGDLDKAREDLEATHRLARLACEDPTLIGALVAIAIDSMACRGDVAVVSTGNHAPEVLEEYLRRLEHLEPMPGMAERVDRMERLMFVDLVVSFARGKADHQTFAMIGQSGIGWLDVARIATSSVDWDAVLREGHRWYDRVVEAMEKDTFTGQQAALEAIDADVQSLGEDARNPIRIAAIVLSDSQTRRQLLGKQIGGVLSSLLLPATHAASAAEHRGKMMFDLTRLAIALEIYRAEMGQYPDSLAALVTETGILEQIPHDRFSGKPLHYQRQDGGYLLSSVGANGQGLEIRVPLVK